MKMKIDDLHVGDRIVCNQFVYTSSNGKTGNYATGTFFEIVDINAETNTIDILAPDGLRWKVWANSQYFITVSEALNELREQKSMINEIPATFNGRAVIQGVWATVNLATERALLNYELLSEDEIEMQSERAYPHLYTLHPDEIRALSADDALNLPDDELEAFEALQNFAHQLPAYIQYLMITVTRR
jgi:hypothetical protein